MLGQEPPIGTGSIDILFDEEKYFESILEMGQDEEKDEDIVQDNTDTFDMDTYEDQKLLRKVCKPDLFGDNIFNIL